MSNSVVLGSGDHCPSTYTFLPGSERLTAPQPSRRPVRLHRARQSRPVAGSAGRPTLRGRPTRCSSSTTTPTPLPRARENIIDSTAAATGELVWRLLPHLGVIPDVNVATCLYTAVLTDTGRFSYSNTTPETLRSPPRWSTPVPSDTTSTRRVREPLGRRPAARRAHARAREPRQRRRGGLLVGRRATSRRPARCPRRRRTSSTSCARSAGVDVVFLAKVNGATVRVQPAREVGRRRGRRRAGARWWRPPGRRRIHGGRRPSTPCSHVCCRCCRAPNDEAAPRSHGSCRRAARRQAGRSHQPRRRLEPSARATGERRIGHSGTLDPMATGLLVVIIGRATRLERYLVGHDKSLRRDASPSAPTDTLDAEGDGHRDRSGAAEVLDDAFAADGAGAFRRTAGSDTAGVLGDQAGRHVGAPCGACGRHPGARAPVRRGLRGHARRHQQPRSHVGRLVLRLEGHVHPLARSRHRGGDGHRRAPLRARRTVAGSAGSPDAISLEAAVAAAEAGAAEVSHRSRRAPRHARGRREPRRRPRRSRWHHQMPQSPKMSPAIVARRRTPRRVPAAR